MKPAFSILFLIVLLFLPLGDLSNIPFSESFLSMAHFPVFWILTASIHSLNSRATHTFLIATVLIILVELIQPLFGRTLSILDGMIGLLAVLAWYGFSQSRYYLGSVASLVFLSVCIFELRPLAYALMEKPFGDFNENRQLYGWRNVGEIGEPALRLMYLDEHKGYFIQASRLDHPYSGVAYDHPWTMGENPSQLHFSVLSEQEFSLEVRIKYEFGGDYFRTLNIGKNSVLEFKVNLPNINKEQFNIQGFALYSKTFSLPPSVYFSNIKLM